MTAGPWRPTCRFVPVMLFEPRRFSGETVKVRMLEYLLHAKNNTMVMV